MKRIVSALLIFAAAAGHCAPEDDLVAARSAALELAGAWSNDGFKLRDGHWNGTIKAGESKLVQVNLYAGNHYWFTLAATKTAKKVSVTVFDEHGKPVTIEPHEDGERAAAGFAPTISGPYWIKVSQLEGEPAAFALVYSYK